MLLCFLHRPVSARSRQSPRSLTWSVYSSQPESLSLVLACNFPKPEEKSCYRIKLVQTRFSGTGGSIPLSLAASMQRSSQAMLLPSARITCMPSAS